MATRTVARPALHGTRREVSPPPQSVPRPRLDRAIGRDRLGSWTCPSCRGTRKTTWTSWGTLVEQYETAHDPRPPVYRGRHASAQPDRGPGARTQAAGGRGRRVVEVDGHGRFLRGKRKIKTRGTIAKLAGFLRHRPGAAPGRVSERPGGHPANVPEDRGLAEIETMHPAFTVFVSLGAIPRHGHTQRGPRGGDVDVVAGMVSWTGAPYLGYCALGLCAEEAARRVLRRLPPVTAVSAGLATFLYVSVLGPIADARFPWRRGHGLRRAGVLARVPDRPSGYPFGVVVAGHPAVLVGVRRPPTPAGPGTKGAGDRGFVPGRECTADALVPGEAVPDASPSRALRRGPSGIGLPRGGAGRPLVAGGPQSGAAP